MAVSRVQNVLGLRTTDLTALMKELGVSSEQSDSFSLVMTNEEWTINSKIREAVQYMGFDARQIIAQFYKKADENRIQEGDVPTMLCGQAKLYERNDPKTDLLFFLNTFIERGNNLSKAVLRCDQGVGDVLRRKAAAYGISMEANKNRTILGTKALTLSRLAQAFSVCTATIILDKQVPGKLKSKLLGTLPVIMQHTIFAGLIPQAADYFEDFKEVAQILNMEMSIMLALPKEKRKMMTKTIEEMLEVSNQYVDAAILGSVVSDVVRCKILVKAGLLDTGSTSGAKVLLTQPSLQMKTIIARMQNIKSLYRCTYNTAVETLLSKAVSNPPGSSSQLQQQQSSPSVPEALSPPPTPPPSPPPISIPVSSQQPLTPTSPLRSTMAHSPDTEITAKRQAEIFSPEIMPCVVPRRQEFYIPCVSTPTGEEKDEMVRQQPMLEQSTVSGEMQAPSLLEDNSIIEDEDDFQKAEF